MALTPRWLWVVGPTHTGKTTFCRVLGRMRSRQSLLFVDLDTTPNQPEALTAYVNREGRPSLSQLTQRIPHTLQEADWRLQESVCLWQPEGDSQAQLLTVGNLGGCKLGPLWQQALTRLFRHFSVVVMDGYQPAWQWCLPEVSLLTLGISTDWADAQPINWANARQLSWLRVAQPDVATPPRNPDALAWPRIGHIPWIERPVSRNPVYRQAVQDAMLRLG